MLWSAWADALGWISELTTPANLRRRTKGRDLTEPFGWHRQIGGRMGVRVSLPEGCYSDDTQLRLATARSISSSGFDVEAFARVELPVWQAYALGGGRASKAAANAMSKHSANWATNFYKGWESAGGNGAAMRIQPHVYAAANLMSFRHLDDVIKNSIVTHGHPNGIAGAVFHAVTLTFALEFGSIPEPNEWPKLLGVIRDAVGVFYNTPELAAYWMPQWESVSGEEFRTAWHRAVDDIQRLLDYCIEPYYSLKSAGGNFGVAKKAYEPLVAALGLDQEQTRGSGVATAIAGLVLASAYPERPAQAARLAASRLATDTDTIATMAAALVGAVSPTELPSPLLDAEYISDEAERLARISEDEPVKAFPYPDLLRWAPPKTGLDSVGIADGGLAVAGLGWVQPVGDSYSSGAGNWQWMKSTFGPTMLLKHRSEPPALPQGNWPNDRRLRQQVRSQGVSESKGSSSARISTDFAQLAIGDSDGGQSKPTDPRIELEVILNWLKKRQYVDRDLGYAFRRVVESGTDEQLSQFTREVARALRPSKEQ
nr:ADP-ribosylglycohydrolase family protein [Nocardia kruczakiae]